MAKGSWRPRRRCRAPGAAAGRRHLSPADLRAVSQWIRLNGAVLIDYWEERIFTDDLLHRLQRQP
jgi:hypothetical protein